MGNTFFERDLKYNHLETALAVRWPGRNVTFRNLGWDGDTVWGDARAQFGSAADGFNSLSKHVADLKPTVIVVAYGMSESFAGAGGVDALRPRSSTRCSTCSRRTQARIVLLSPLRHEDLARPLPDPADHNRDLRLYVDAIAKVAGRRNHDFVNLFDLAGSKEQPLTQNGIHLNDLGYSRRVAGRSSGPSALPLLLGGRDRRPRQVARPGHHPERPQGLRRRRDVRARSTGPSRPARGR